MSFDEEKQIPISQSSPGFFATSQQPNTGFPSYPTAVLNFCYPPQMPGFQFPVPQTDPQQGATHSYLNPGTNFVGSQAPIFNLNSSNPSAPPNNTTKQSDGSTSYIGHVGRPQQGLKWVKASGKLIPEGAVQGGLEADGKPLYVARGYHKGSLVIGKAGGHLNGCLIPFDGKEVHISDYHVLVGDATKLKWRQCVGKLEVDGWVPLEAGNEPNGDELFVAKTFYKNGEVIGKVSFAMSHGMTFSYGGKEIASKENIVYYVLSHA